MQEYHKNDEKTIREFKLSEILSEKDNFGLTNL